MKEVARDDRGNGFSKERIPIGQFGVRVRAAVPNFEEFAMKLPAASATRRSMRRTGRGAWISLTVALGMVGQTFAQGPGILVLDERQNAPAVVQTAAVPMPAGGSVSNASEVTVSGATTLDTCLAVAMSHQPALAAARASLSAAESGKRGVDSLGFGAVLLSPDLPIRRKQACLGVTIAAAGLQQAEWETRYAVARTYFSVLYARQQRLVVDSVIEKLGSSQEKAKRFVDAGDPNIKVTQIDVDTLAVNLEFAKAKRIETEVGVQKAMAALREAMGVGLDYPLSVPEEPLPGLVQVVDKQQLISSALTHRGELAQAACASEVADLEITAQRRLFFKPTTKTFAAASDIHAKPIPQGVANGEYRPGAIGLEMPVFFVGKRPHRIDRAEDLSARASAVVDKTTNLITLEVEAAYLKWQEAADKVRTLASTPVQAAKVADKVQGRFDAGNVTGEELLRARTLEDYARSHYNEALFNHAVALATLERVTAGGYGLAAALAQAGAPAAAQAAPAPGTAPKELP